MEWAMQCKHHLPTPPGPSMLPLQAKKKKKKKKKIHLRGEKKGGTMKNVAGLKFSMPEDFSK